MKDNYNWEIQTRDGRVHTKGEDFDPNSVVRVSFISNRLLLPRHDIVLTDFKFKKRFCRGMIKQSKGMKEYLHIVVTDNFRFYLKSSNGQVLVTSKDYELYL